MPPLAWVGLAAVVVYALRQRGQAAPGLAPTDGVAVAAAAAWRGMLGLPATTAVAVRRVEPHAWPDASLGLGDPGTSYAQVVTPGYLVELALPDGRVAEMHCDTNGRCRYCSPCSNRLAGLGG